MKRAIAAAKNAQGEIPIGAVIVKDGEVIVSTCNRKEVEKDVTSHAEILALRKAADILGRWRLNDCEMYVTLEPCPMCAWAILQARLKRVYFGSYDTNYGAFGSAIDLRELAHSTMPVYGGIMEEECNKILDEYFQKMRTTQKNNKEQEDLCQQKQVL